MRPNLTAIIVVAGLCASIAQADGTVDRQTAVKLYRGLSIIAASDPKSGKYVVNLTPEACEQLRDERWRKEAATRTTGSATYKCQVETRAIVTFRPAPTCGDKPADEQQKLACPAGTIGTWLQDHVYTLQPAPECWVLGDWTPTVPPEGMCAPIEPEPVTRFTKWASPSGSPSSACTQTAPCTLTRALAIAVAGDEVSVAPGLHTTACNGSRYTPAFNPGHSGTSVTRQIAFRGGGGTTTELRCASGAGAVFGAYGRSWIIWDGFYVNETRSPSVSDTGPVVVWASQYVTIKSSVIEGNPIAREDNHNGIRIEQSRDVTIDDNTITGIRHTAGASQNFAGIMGYDAVRVTVNANTIRDCDVAIFPKGDHNIGFGLGEWRITSNRLDARRTAIQIGGLKTGSGYGRSLIQDNVMIGSGLAGVVLLAYDGVSPRAIDIANNTIVGYGAAILATTPGGSQSQVDITIRNNVLVGAQVAVNIHWTGSRSTWAEDYNLLWPVAGSRGGWYTDGNTRDSLSAWRTATGMDAHSISVDPRMTTDYQLPAGHAARTAGSNTGLMGAR